MSFRICRDDLIEFMQGERHLVGRALYILEQGTTESPYNKWMVYCLSEHGRAFMCQVWENEAGLFHRCDFNIRTEIDWVVYDALGSGKNWGAMPIEAR